MNGMNDKDQPVDWEKRCRQLEDEVAQLRLNMRLWPVNGGETVRVPESMQPLFDEAQKTVASYFASFQTDPTRATIKINDQRYVLMRASSLSVDFLKTVKNLYADYGEDEALAIGRSFLFDIAHVLGIEDAKKFHETMGVTDPIARLSTGPVHFAYAGWAFVDIFDESTPSPDENFFIKYGHPFSFEADAFLEAGEVSNCPVCIMNAGYSSGWCEQSFGIDLTAVEITCKAAGDEQCTFIMAPPHRIEKYLHEHMPEHRLLHPAAHRIPTFFERKRVEQELQAARRKAEESDRMKSQFLTNISHELRTPMNALIGMTELVLDSPLESIQRDNLNTVLESSELLMGIIDQILDFSKIGSGTIGLQNKSFLLRGCLTETLRSLEVTAEQKNLALRYSVADNVPEKLRGDSLRMQQILVNLIGNAIKFTSKGYVSVSVTAKPTATGQTELQFSVQDSGVGIPEEKQEEIFEPFTQVDMSSTRSHAGTGLGLAISASLVEMLGGRIWVENNPSEAGSLFQFTAIFNHDKPSDYPDLIGQEVVIASPNPQHLRVLESALTKEDMRVITAESANDALQLLAAGFHRKLRPMLITCLPDNIVLVELVRGKPETRNAPVVTINTNLDEADRARLDQMNACCLSHAFKQSELMDALMSVHTRGTIPAPEASSSDDKTPSVVALEKATGIRVLLVEDGVANQKFAVSMLSRWGHTVTVVNNGQEALDTLATNPHGFDLVLMDVLMPVMDGLQCASEIRLREQETGDRITIVAITAQAMPGDREKCMAAGMDHYLTKPIRRRELQELIERLSS